MEPPSIEPCGRSRPAGGVYIPQRMFLQTHEPSIRVLNENIEHIVDGYGDDNNLVAAIATQFVHFLSQQRFRQPSHQLATVFPRHLRPVTQRECEGWIQGGPILNEGDNMIALPGVWNGRPTRAPMSRYPSEIIIRDVGNNDAVFRGRGIEPAWRGAEEIVRILRGAQVQDIAPDIMSSSTAQGLLYSGLVPDVHTDPYTGARAGITYPRAAHEEESGADGPTMVSLGWGFNERKKRSRSRKPKRSRSRKPKRSSRRRRSRSRKPKRRSTRRRSRSKRTRRTRSTRRRRGKR